MDGICPPSAIEASLCNSYEYCVPLDKIFECLIFK